MKNIIESIEPVLMSRDVERSIGFYKLLGFRVLGQDSQKGPRYARLCRDNAKLDLQWHDEKEWNHPFDRPTYRFLVNEVDGLYEEFRQAAALVDATAVVDTTWGTREFHVRDPDMNGLQFYRWLQ